MGIVFYSEEQDAPVLRWLEGLPERAYAKGIVRIERLAQLGHELRRPQADYLRDGIYELRWRMGSVNYRILYFFHLRDAVVLAHGLTKEVEVPKKEINLALSRKAAYFEHPEKHTCKEELK